MNSCPISKDSLLKAQAISHGRGERLLFKNLSLEVNSGEILYIQGANGTGKTTLLKVLSGILMPQEGNVYWGSVPLKACWPSYACQRLFIGHQDGLKTNLSVFENLEYATRLAYNEAAPQLINAALQQMGLFKFSALPVTALSAGQRRRLAMARLLTIKAQLWILDEPFTSLDQMGVQQLQQLFKQHITQDGMIILTSHQMPDEFELQYRTLRLVESLYE